MKREISNCQREIQDTETGRWAGYVGLCRIISYESADSLFTVALAEVNLVHVTSVEPSCYERSAPERGILTRCFTSFQLVSPGFS
ncbi:MAG TPA: hypothetical protein VFB72_19585, partial [Verrucomicrobiae bacterium]|nr:hypothetical protein [Verrucomicrobiae bacterium]